ncbi:venom prothrombin activator oscutarin-C non-catalytic subunit [Nematostella vectensis]|uniref:venom prothrombin activator oscutarin-C non-catalytic subunit n=1 Tax=Nematostella vectensis TaxID=45351 RepID=UPI0020777C70|nr:venom prothrombin activator oscutarin-C non-catalytic subunit [Nematostella vectensis]
MDLKQITKIKRVATQGRPDSNQWVKSYRLEYSYDNGYYQPYSNGKSMPGNTNRDDEHVNILQPVIITRYIRVCPMQYQSHIAMRVEIYGCHEGFQVSEPPQCQSKIDMKDNQMTASSEYNSASKPQNARLHFNAQSGRYGGWVALVNDMYQFLQVDLGHVTKVTRVSAQGRQGTSQWGTQYSLEYSLDDAVFIPYSGVNEKLKVAS